MAMLNAQIITNTFGSTGNPDHAMVNFAFLELGNLMFDND